MQRTPANQATCQFHECLMYVGAALEANPAAESMHPSMRAFDHPVNLAQAAAVRLAAPGNRGQNVGRMQRSPVFVMVVAAVKNRYDRPRAAWPAAARATGPTPQPAASRAGDENGSISLCSLPHGVALSISARKRSRRVNFFLAEYSRSDKLLCMINLAVVNVPLLSQVAPTGEMVGGE